MTRREWLQKNPPPRTAGHTKGLLVELQAQDLVRQQYETNKQIYVSQHVPYWNEAIVRTTSAGDTAALAHARAELAKIEREITAIDTQLRALANLPARIVALTSEIATGAKCPTHKLDLERHRNRPEDLFVCNTGPHYLLWTKNGTAGGFADIDIKKPLPDLDAALDWL